MRMRLDPRRLHAEAELDAIAGEHFLDRLGEVGVLAREHAFAAHQHGHAAAEASKHLREFERDITRADNHQMLGQLGQFEQSGIGVVANPLEAFDLRHDARACRC